MRKTRKRMMTLILVVLLLGCMVVPALASSQVLNETTKVNLLESANGIKGISTTLTQMIQSNEIDLNKVVSIDVVTATSMGKSRNVASENETVGAVMVVTEEAGEKEISALIPIDDVGVPLSFENVIDLGLQNSYEFTGGLLIAKYSQYMYQDTMGAGVFVNPRSVSVKTTSAAVVNMEARYYVHGDLYNVSSTGTSTTVSSIPGMIDIEGELRVAVGLATGGNVPLVGTYYSQYGAAANGGYLYPFTATNKQALKLTAMGGTPMFMLTVGYYDENWNYYEYQVDHPF